MRVVVVGSGGREHALAWRLSESPAVEEVKVWPGNGGTAASGWVLDEASSSAGDPVDVLTGIAPDLVVIGPEAPLVEGLADRLRARGLAVFGPGADGARLEGSKIFAKEFMLAAGIPTARAVVVDSPGTLSDALEEMGERAVLKADGLAAGKGVLLPENREDALARGAQMLSGAAFGDAGRRLLVEERLAGYEVSLIAVCDGRRYFLLPASQDHKRALEGDRGPNTGGMGAYSPVPGLDERACAELGERIFTPALAALRSRGIEYRGALYAGLMICPMGPRVLEFNCRFGDPETQVLLPLLAGDFAGLLAGAAAGELPSAAVSIRPQAAVTVVLASAGYPGAYETGYPIAGLGPTQGDESYVFHAGTRLDRERVLSAGGRVLAVTALGRDLAQAADRCYRRVESLSFEGRTFRRDIGWRVLSGQGGAL